MLPTVLGLKDVPLLPWWQWWPQSFSEIRPCGNVEPVCLQSVSALP